MTTRTAADSIAALKNEADRPSLVALSYALRHPETWPEGFVWDFHDFHQCAIGLASALWALNKYKNREEFTSQAARTFAMPFGEAQRIFWDGRLTVPAVFGLTTRIKKVEHDEITPEMIADEIDRFLESAE